MKALIVSAGEIKDYSYYKDLRYDLILSADNGYMHCKNMGVEPHVIIGDFDSYKGKLPENIKVIKYPKKKDKSDTEICVDYALANGFTNITLLGCFGGRVDHFMSSLLLLNKIYDSDAHGKIINEQNEILLTKSSCTIKKGNYKYISLIPLFGEVTGVYARGVEYPLENETLTPNNSLGLSNTIKSETAEIKINNGTLAIICSND